MGEETRDEKLLRILTSSIAGKEDWPEAKYLIDKGYADGSCLLSHMSSTKGEIIDLQLRSPIPTTTGEDFIEILRTRTKFDNPNILQNPKRNERSNEPRIIVQKHPQESSLKIIAIGVSIAVLAAMFLWAANEYFGVHLK